MRSFALLRLCVRQAWRELRAGDLRTLLASLLLAVLAAASVDLSADRISRALNLQAAQLLGADAILEADQPLAAALRTQATQLGLQTTATVTFPSMVKVGTRFQLSELKAIEPNWPLRGELVLETQSPGGLAPQHVWAGSKLVRMADGERTLKLGEQAMLLASAVISEPDAALDYFSGVAPRVYLRIDDVPKTGLLVEGARAQWQLGVAGDSVAVQQWVAAMRAQLQRGQRLKTLDNARPELNSALQRGFRFLGLTSLLTALMCALAVALSARRYVERQLDTCALLRTLGASQNQILLLVLAPIVATGVLACLGGAALGMLGQALLASALKPLFGIALPAPSLLPLYSSIALGVFVLIAGALPPLLRLRDVPALRVLRRELSPRSNDTLALFLGLAATLGVLIWKAGSWLLAGVALSGLLLGAGVLMLGTWLLLRALRPLARRLRGSARLGLARLLRRPALSALQAATLGLSLSALLLLTLVRTDLLSRWQSSRPSDAPNRFLINVQPDQVASLQERLTALGLPGVAFYPMVRGRLASINGKKIASDSFADAGLRAQRLAEREFNLSFSDQLKPDNQVLAGNYWTPATASLPQWSVEQGLAETLGIKLGDRLQFEVTGILLDGEITSLRKVEWESFAPNFFVVGPNSQLEGLPASYLTSVRIAAHKEAALDQINAEFPNLTVIALDQIMATVERLGSQVSRAMELVFWFALGGGVLVLLAALAASQDERARELAVLRALGASNAQLRGALLSEFAVLGAVAGLGASLAAALVAELLARFVFKLEFRLDAALLAWGTAAGIALVLSFGMASVRRLLRETAIQSLRRLS